MKIKSIDFKGNKGQIHFEDTEIYFLNSLRRIMLSELPKLAIEDVIIYDNTSPLFDEIIAQRLAMIPIPTDLKLITFRSECTCEGKGCPNCTVRYTLSKEGEGTVYSGDLQPEQPTWAIKETKIPIVELSKDQRIILEVEAILGRARDHAKWQTVIAPTYQMETNIEFDKKRMPEVKEFISELPKDIIAEIKGDKIVLKDPTKLALFESILDASDVEYISIRKDPNRMMFSFETDGSLSAQDALRESIRILTGKYEELNKQLKDVE
ncbi:MAG: DNA-directed RNA polymerase subunit D [Candidatus Thermoplasmatota archaeon]